MNDCSGEIISAVVLQSSYLCVIVKWEIKKSSGRACQAECSEGITALALTSYADRTQQTSRISGVSQAGQSRHDSDPGFCGLNKPAAACAAQPASSVHNASVDRAYALSYARSTG